MTKQCLDRSLVSTIEFVNIVGVNVLRTLSLSNRWVRFGLLVLALCVERGISYLLGVDRLIPGFGGEGGLLLVWAIGHCDTLNGPVVTSARTALEMGNVNHVLPWVLPKDEQEIRHAFDHATAVRKLGPDAKELADTHFFETLVRVHRASEGAPYTGLKPVGADLDLAIPAADRALEDGSAENVAKLLADTVRDGIQRHHAVALSLKKFAVDDVAAGRRYVEAYVRYIHYVERIWEAATGTLGAHGQRDEPATVHKHAAHGR